MKTERNEPPRRGAILLEAGASLLVIGLVLAITAQMLGWMAAERRLSRQRLWARQEAANLLERVRALPATERDVGRLAASALGERAAKELPGGVVAWAVAADPEIPELQRVTLTIRWRGSSGMPAPTVRLTEWFDDAPAAGRDR